MQRNRTATPAPSRAALAFDLLFDPEPTAPREAASRAIRRPPPRPRWAAYKGPLLLGYVTADTWGAALDLARHAYPQGVSEVRHVNPAYIHPEADARKEAQP